MDFKGVNYYLGRGRNNDFYGGSQGHNSTSNFNIKFNFSSEMMNSQYEVFMEKQKKEMELMDSEIQKNRFDTLRDCIRMEMSDREISEVTGFTEAQIYNYRNSFKK